MRTSTDNAVKGTDNAVKGTDNAVKEPLEHPGGRQGVLIMLLRVLIMLLRVLIMLLRVLIMLLTVEAFGRSQPSRL